MTKTPEWDIASSVGVTALAVAGARAMETSRPDPLTSDPFAAAFLDAARTRSALPDILEGGNANEVWGYLTDYMALRTRFLDDYFAAADPAQVVILASGLDARAYRLPWREDCELFEVDQPLVLDFKQDVAGDVGARPRCVHHLIRADLREDWVSALLDAGFDRNTPTSWLAEGLLPYLPGEAEEALFDSVHELSAPGSTIAVEKTGTRTLADIKNHPLFEEAKGALTVNLDDLWSDDPRRDCAAWLASVGWEVGTTTVAELERRYERPLPEGTGGAMERNVMVTATKR